MLGNGGLEVNVIHPICRAEQHNILVCPQEKLPIENHIPQAEPGMQILETMHRPGQQKHTALLFVQAPLPAHIQVVCQ